MNKVTIQIGNKIKQARLKKEIRQSDLAALAGCASAYITQLEKGRSLPSKELAEKIEKALELEQNSIVSLVAKSKLLDFENLDLIYSSNVVENKLDNMLRIPILGTVPASPLGKEFTYDHVEEWISVPRSMTKGKKMYFVRAKGDCMSPVINEGAIILIDAENHDPVNGDIVVAIIDGEWTLKRFYRQNSHIILKPDNPAYQPRFYDDKNEITLRGVLHGIFPKGI